MIRKVVIVLLTLGTVGMCWIWLSTNRQEVPALLVRYPPIEIHVAYGSLWVSSEPTFRTWLTHPVELGSVYYANRFARPEDFVLRLPLWSVACAFAAAFIGLLGTPAYRRWSRRRAGGCAECGYSLTGNVSGVCPECGTEVKKP